MHFAGSPGDAVVKNPPASAGNAGDRGSVPGWGRSPGIGIGTLLQYSCLENSMDRVTWLATVHGIAKSWTPLSTCARTHTHTHTQILQRMKQAKKWVTEITRLLGNVYLCRKKKFF